MNTKNVEKKKINWFRTIRPIALALVLVTLLTYATYAWMKRDWTPTLRENNVKIVAGSSLVFMFDNKVVEDVAINELMGEFVFKSVSNSSGESDHFFALNYSPKGEYYDSFKNLSLNELSAEDRNSTAPYTILGQKHGYVELTFKVKAPAGDNEKDKRIYLDSDSKIGAAAQGDATKGANAVKAMRVSITVPDSENGNETTKTIIYSQDGTHKGITNAFVEGKGYVANDANRYNPVGSEMLTTSVDGHKLVIAPSEQNTVKTEVKSLPITDDGYLFTLKKATEEELTVRIWLEGEDANCTDEKVLGAALDILVKFAAEDVEA